VFRSYHLFSIFGIPVCAHGTLPLLLVVALLYSSGEGSPSFALTTLFLFMILVSVFLHELGHSAVALWHRIAVQKITLYPFFAAASLRAVQLSPPLEFRIALAGPLVNLVLAGLLSPVYFLDHPPWIFKWLLVVNLFLAVFNLLPGFPMDGGRVFRAFLAKNRPYLEATRIAVRVGQWVAMVLGIIGLFTDFLLCLFAVYIYFMGKAELLSVGVGAPWQRLNDLLRDASGMRSSRGGAGEEPSSGGRFRGRFGPLQDAVDPSEDAGDVVIEVGPDGKVHRVQRGRGD
jgi:Zn-dependent protease